MKFKSQFLSHWPESLWCQPCSVCIKLHLALEQQRFECCGYTYTWIFLKSKYSSTWPVVDWICRCRTMDIEGCSVGLGYRGVLGVCNFLSSVSSQQKFEVTDIQALGMSQLSKRPKRSCLSSQIDCVTALGKISVTAQFYLESKGIYILEARGHADPKDTKREWEREWAHTREIPGPLGSLFTLTLFLPLSLPYVNWASQEYCLFYLRSSLQSSDLSLFYSPGLFPFLSFSHYYLYSFFLF